MSSFIILMMMNIFARKCAMDEVFSHQISKTKTPSLQYLFFDADDILYQKRMGAADIYSAKSTDEYTTYSFFSITKTVTALCVLQLVERGEIDLDGTVKTYMANFPYSPDITVRQLLNHTSGISNPIPLSWIHLDVEHKQFDQDRFFRKIFEKHPRARSKPGEHFHYSNLGYVLLGQLIEAVSGDAYEKYVDENVLKRMGIQYDISFSISENHAVGYQKRFSFMNFVLGLFLDKSKYMDGIHGEWISFRRTYVNGSAYGGLMGNANGLMRYLQALLRPDCTLISKEFKKILFAENHTDKNGPTGMCLSWFKGNLTEHEYFTHAGGGGGYYAEVRLYPKLRLGSLILLNRSGMKDVRLLDEIDKHFFGLK